MHVASRALALSGLVALAACAPTRIPPPPAHFDTIVVASDLAPTELYADALAAFFRANWGSVPGRGDADALSTWIVPDGARLRPDGSGLALHVTVRAVTAPPDTTAPGLTDGDYAGPDLSRRTLNDPARGQNDPDSLFVETIPDGLTVGDAVLTARIDGREAGARDVLIRAARILAGVEGTLSYR